MQKISTMAYPLLALIAWALATALVVNLMGGTFASGRSCQTACFQVLYWSALACAAFGFAGSLWHGLRNRFTLLLAVSSLALFALLLMLLVTALIGSL